MANNIWMMSSKNYICYSSNNRNYKKYIILKVTKYNNTTKYFKMNKISIKIEYKTHFKLWNLKIVKRLI
jgi:hypothetical protein